MINTGAKILIIDDDKQIRKFLRICLEAHGYEVEEASSGQLGIKKAALSNPTLIILDLGLPDGDGAEILSQLNEWSKIPVIILSARDADSQIVTLLDMGAVDYVIKPFNTEQLLARIRAALRHAFIQAGNNPILVFDQVKIDFANRSVYRQAEKIKLTKKEYEILRLLMMNAGKVVTHDFLLNEVWGPVYKDNIEYLRTYIRQIRLKIEADPANPTIIQSESGIGYRCRVADT